MRITLDTTLSIEEANAVFNDRIARIISAGANDRKVLAYGSFNIWWRNITKKKLSRVVK